MDHEMGLRIAYYYDSAGVEVYSDPSKAASITVATFLAK